MTWGLLAQGLQQRVNAQVGTHDTFESFGSFILAQPWKEA